MAHVGLVKEKKEIDYSGYLLGEVLAKFGCWCAAGL